VIDEGWCCVVVVCEWFDGEDFSFG